MKCSQEFVRQFNYKFFTSYEFHKVSWPQPVAELNRCLHVSQLQRDDEYQPHDEKFDIVLGAGGAGLRACFNLAKNDFRTRLLAEGQGAV